MGRAWLQRSLAAPSRRSDALALLAVALAFFARTQFTILVFVLPLAILGFEAGRLAGGRAHERLLGSARAAVRAHRLLAYAYALLAVAAVALAAGGRLSHLLGIYRGTVQGDLLPPGTATAFTQNLATIALALGVVPVVAGVGWLLANVVAPSTSRELHAFSCIATLSAVAIPLEAASFDQRLGVGYIVLDRYLFYLVPIVVLAFICALLDERRLRWSLVLPALIVTIGFATGPLQTSLILRTDTVVWVLHDYILRSSTGSAAAGGRLRPPACSSRWCSS